MSDFGPVQLLAMQFPDPELLQGHIIAELEQLDGKGLIRVLDLLIVTRSGDDLIALELPGEDSEFGAILGALLGFGFEGSSVGNGEAPHGHENRWGISPEHLEQLAAGIEEGSIVGLLLFEHAWAKGLRGAIMNAGGVPLAQGFLVPETLELVSNELSAMARALDEVARTASV